VRVYLISRSVRCVGVLTCDQADVSMIKYAHRLVRGRWNRGKSDSALI